MAKREAIFDARERTTSHPSSAQEGTFVFLNRIANDYWEHPRSLVQAWADHLDGDQDYSDMRSRLRSGDDYQFRSAFLELYIHEILLRTGHEVTIHPTSSDSKRRPDFYAHRAGRGFYVEATAPGVSPTAHAAGNRRDRLFDVINQLSSPNFTLWLTGLEAGSSSPQAKKFRQRIEHWLGSLNPDDYPVFDSAPVRTFSEGDWAMTFRAIPRPVGARHAGPEIPAIGVYGHMPADSLDDVPKIHKALKAKTRAYGALDAPYVIAVGTYLVDGDRSQARDAMYGRQVLQHDGSGARLLRERDGYFGSPPEWRNCQVSGVLIVDQLMPNGPHRAETTLWMHPAPERSDLPTDVFPGDRVELDGSGLRTTPSPVVAADLFGLEEPWPPGVPFPRQGR